MDDTDDRVRPLLLAQAHTRGAADWRDEDVEPVIARLLAERDALRDAFWAVHTRHADGTIAPTHPAGRDRRQDLTPAQITALLSVT